MGIAFDAAMIYSAFAGSVTLTGYTSSAPYLEGNTFDACGGHASSSTSPSYHYHVAPSCLLAQLGQTAGTHSPQIGWMADGFPVYGPHGPSGVAMRTCTVTGGTLYTDVCLDDCGGYYGDTGDGYVYRYYMQGTYNDGTCCEMPAQTPGGGADYFPFTPACLKGCCPNGVACSMGGVNLPSCSGSDTDAGTTSSLSTAARPALAVNSGSTSDSWAACTEANLCCETSIFGTSTPGYSPFCAPSSCASSVPTCTYQVAAAAVSSICRHCEVRTIDCRVAPILPIARFRSHHGQTRILSSRSTWPRWRLPSSTMAFRQDPTRLRMETWVKFILFMASVPPTVEL